MRWQNSPFVVPLIITAVIALALAVYVSRHRPRRGATALFVVLLALTVWSLGYALELGAVELPAKLFWARVQYLGIVVLPVSWLVFAIRYANRDQWLTTRRVGLLSILPAVTLLLVWTNAAHHWVWARTALDAQGAFVVLDVAYGPWFWIFSAYSYLLLFVGTLRLLRMLLHYPQLYRQQAGVLLLGLAAPWVGNILYLLGLFPISGLDLTPFAFTLTGAALTWGLFSFQLFEIAPVARRMVVDEMSDSVLVLDSQGRVVDLNRAAGQVLGMPPSQAIGRPLASLCSEGAKLTGHDPDARDEIRLSLGADPAVKWYEIKRSALRDGRGRQTGQLIVLRDVTERRRLFNEQRRLAEHQTILFQVLRAVAGQTDPKYVARAAVEALAKLADWPNTCIAVPDLSRSEWLALAASGTLLPVNQKRFPLEQGIIGRALRTAQTQRVPDVLSDPDYVVVDATSRSELAVPIQRGGRLLGVLNLERDHVDAFDDDDVQLAQALAEAIGLALDHAEIYSEAQQNAANLSALYTVTRLAGQSLMLQDVLAQTLSAMLTSLGFEAGLISLAAPGHERLTLVAERGLPPALSERLGANGLEGTLCASVYDSQESLVIGDLKVAGLSSSENALESQALEPNTEPFRQALSEYGMRAFAGIPLSHRGEALGSMSLLDRQPRSFASDELALLRSIGQQVATAVAHARLFQAIADEHSRMQELIASSRDGIVMVGTDQRVLLSNAQALRLLHLPDEPQDWIGRPMRDVVAALERVAPEVARTTLAEMNRVQQGDGQPGEGEFVVSPHTLHWLNLPVQAGDLSLGRLLVLYDVTEERLLEKMRDDLTRTMVHDLRNPLTSVQMSLYLIDQLDVGNLTAQQQDMLGRAHAGLDRTLKLVNGILAMSRLESGRMPLQRTAVDLGDLVSNTIQAQAALAADKHLRLESDIQPALPSVSADAELIERTLQNLIDNAIKFTPEAGEVRVAVGGAPTDPPQLIVSVTDSGPGIPPDLKPRLFQKFATGHQEASGSGLGLAFCKLVVEAHGGRIWAESAPRSGATFRFTLPVDGEA